VEGVVEEGGIAVGRVGMALGSTALLICVLILDCSNSELRGIVAVATTQSISIAPARVHVAFSRKSAVFRIPIVCPAEVKFAASPPPFEFWTSTIITWNIQAIMIKIDTKI